MVAGCTSLPLVRSLRHRCADVPALYFVDYAPRPLLEARLGSDAALEATQARLSQHQEHSGCPMCARQSHAIAEHGKSAELVRFVDLALDHLGSPGVANRRGLAWLRAVPVEALDAFLSSPLDSGYAR